MPAHLWLLMEVIFLFGERCLTDNRQEESEIGSLMNAYVIASSSNALKGPI